MIIQTIPNMLGVVTCKDRNFLPGRYLLFDCSLFFRVDNNALLRIDMACKLKEIRVFETYKLK